jgi:hypothetical protein
MINLLNKILSRFHLKLVYTKPDTRLVDETVKFLNTFSSEELRNDGLLPPYVGDITFVEGSKTYFRQVVGTEHKYFDYDGNTYTPEELQTFLIKKNGEQFSDDELKTLSWTY